MYYDLEKSGSRIRDLRKSLGWTQERFAEKLGVSREFVGRIEQGKNGASVDLLIQISEVFDVTLDYIIKGTQDKTDKTIGRTETILLEMAGLQEKLKLIPIEKQQTVMSIMMNIIETII